MWWIIIGVVVLAVIAVGWYRGRGKAGYDPEHNPGIEKSRGDGFMY